MGGPLTISQRTNADGFPKPGELIEITGASALEASDRAIADLLYRHAHDSGQIGESRASWKLPITALRPSSHNGTGRVHDSLDRLLSVRVKVSYTNEDGEPRTLKTHLFDFFDLPTDETDGRGIVRYGLPGELQPIVAQSRRWGRVRAEIVCAMTSKYAIALYEMIQLRAKMDRCFEAFPIELFRELIGVAPGKLLRGPDFMRYCIQPALLEVNGLSDYGAEMAFVRRNAVTPIEAVRVTWWRKDDAALLKPQQELKQPKLGRMARLRGTVETARPAPRALPTLPLSRAAEILAELDARYPTDQERIDHDREYRAAFSSGSKREPRKSRGESWRRWLVEHVASEAAA